MRFRQVHLDFHTSPYIPEIGAKFDKKHWQETLKAAAVDSITCFSSCHHGWSYHPTQVGKMHPNLNFNLLRAQMDACHEIGINVPIYLTGGVNDMTSVMHPEWQEVYHDGRIHAPLNAAFRKMCFNSPYLDYLCDMIREAVTMFPDADGVFIDIISQGQCCCKYCIQDMLAEGYDPESEADRKRFARRTLLKYYKAVTAAARCNDPDMPVFHNSGNIAKGDREILPYFSHYELESLPTGGWGYDHYPMSAAYCRNLDKNFLGMTGKFHTTWGEFGGFKHVNALRYECAAMLANGSRCSIGDQLHPCGKLDDSTYALIGTAYREVAEKEAYCKDVKSAASIAILGEESIIHDGRWEYHGDIGAARMLLELHQPFDYVDTEMEFDRYKILILPDCVRLDSALESKVLAFLEKGGKLVLSGTSGMKADSDEFCFDIGAEGGKAGEYNPDYVLADEKFAPENISTPFVMYSSSRRIKAKPGVCSLGKIYDPYFNRNYQHYSSHQHTPYCTEDSGFDAGVMTGNILYFAHSIFSIYRAFGTVLLKHFFRKAFEAFAGNSLQVRSSIPSQGRITIMEQEKENRTIVHLLYANTMLRGGVCKLSGGTNSCGGSIEVIEELNPCPSAKLSIAFDKKVVSVNIVPEGTPLDFVQKDGRLEVDAGSFTCHRMLEINY